MALAMDFPTFENSASRLNELHFGGLHDELVLAGGQGRQFQFADAPAGVLDLAGERRFAGDVAEDADGGGVEADGDGDGVAFGTGDDRLEDEVLFERGLRLAVNVAHRLPDLSILKRGNVFE